MKISLLFLILYSLTAYSQRTLKLAPLRVNTVHGGRVSSSSYGCASADMIGSEFMYAPNSGVAMANHVYILSLRNVSDVAQTVRISVGGDTKVDSNHSSGGSGESIIPDEPGPYKTCPTSLRGPILIPGGTTYRYAFEVWVGPLTDHWVFRDSLGFIDGNNSLITGAGCNPLIAKKNCISMNSQVQFTISVDEDSGALVGSIAATAHRCGGHKDHFLSSITSQDLAGGKAF